MTQTVSISVRDMNVGGRTLKEPHMQTKNYRHPREGELVSPKGEPLIDYPIPTDKSSNYMHTSSAKCATIRRRKVHEFERE